VEKDADDASCFARRTVIPRTPPQAKAHPAPLRGAPGAPKRNQGRAITPFDAEDEELSDYEEEGNPSGSDITLVAPKSPTQTLGEAIELLRKMRPSGQNVAIKEEVLRLLEETIQQMENPSQHTVQPPQRDVKDTDRITSIENDIKEIKEAIKEAISAKSRTWAQIAASPKDPETNNRQRLKNAQRERLEKAKKERAKTEVILTLRNANERVKQELEKLHEGAIADSLQQSIQQHMSTETIKICGVKKISKNMLKVKCDTEKDAVQLRELDWGHALEGGAVIKPTYGIVVHGVSKQDINTEAQSHEEIKARIEHTNRIKVERVALLRRRARNPNAPTHSIVIFTECPKEADGCILDGVHIGNRHHAAERYAPQCQIKQCFNCQAYGHKADICIKKPKCGRCAQEHETRSCSSEALQCAALQGRACCLAS
jgi:hypothetical protein